SVVFPPASHLLVAPLFVAGLVACLGAWFRSTGWERAGLVALPVFITGTLWFRVALGIAAAVNVSALPIIALAFTLVATPLLLVVERQSRLRLGLTIGAALLTAGTFTYPAYDASWPQRASIVHFTLEDEEP